MLKNNKFKFPIKITIYTEFLVYDTEYIIIHFDQQHTVDITHVTNYNKYFKNNKVLYQDILNHYFIYYFILNLLLNHYF